jgi:hypothetical protein
MTPRRTWPQPTWRGIARLLALVVVTAFAGSLMGPVIGGSFGYAWGYLGGVVGPFALLAFALWCSAWLLRVDPLP